MAAIKQEDAGKFGQVSWKLPGGAVSAVERHLAGLRAAGNRPVWAAAYASPEQAEELKPVFLKAGAWKEWPLMLLLTEPGTHGGLQTMSLPGGISTALHSGDRVTGMTWKDAGGRQRASLCGLIPSRKTTDPAQAVVDAMEEAARLLKIAGLAWPDVYRTWYYNDRILEWYTPFNKLRRDYYLQQVVTLERPPASTGIGLANFWRTPLVLSLLAARPAVEPGPVSSPLQNQPTSYGSYFSRASEEGTDGGSALWVSGTAAIDQIGNTLYLGNFTAQVKETFRVVDALLRSRGMGWGGVKWATAYISRTQDMEIFEKLKASGELPLLNPVVIPATVCRDNLLFELEMMAER